MWTWGLCSVGLCEHRETADEVAKEDRLCDASVSFCMCLWINVCVQWSKAAIRSSLSCLPVSVLTRLCCSMATNLHAAGPHPPLLPSLSPCLQKIHSVKYWHSVAVGLNQFSAGQDEGPMVGCRSGGAPHPHTQQHALSWHLSCHCETPTLGCLCQQWPCALSLAVLFMGTCEVARRVVGSGRGFLQHCSLYLAVKQQDKAAKRLLVAGLPWFA